MENSDKNIHRIINPLQVKIKKIKQKMRHKIN